MNLPLSFPLAINIALIPEQTVYEQCLHISQELSNKQSSPYLLGRDGIPHITLAQGCITSQHQLSKLESALASLIPKLAIPQLTTQGILQPHGDSLWWGLETTSSLYTYHEQVIKVSQPLLNQDANDGMFIIPDKLRGNKEVNWVKSFMKEAVFENFTPHLTLGYGQPQSHWPTTATFQAASIGIFWMGPYCSCYQPIKEWKLS